MARETEDPTQWSYDAVLSSRGGRYYLHVRELSLIAEGSDLSEAHAALEAARRDLFRKAAVLRTPLPLPRDAVERRKLRAEIVPFLIKCAAIAAVGSILIVASGVAINYSLRNDLRNAAQKTSRAAMEQIIRGIEDMGRRDLTADREARLRLALRGAVPVLKPFIEELRPLFSNETVDESHGRIAP